MRWAGLAVILLSFPLFAALLGRVVARRDMAVIAIGALLFFAGTLSPSAALYVWPGWLGLSKGVFISLVDTAALALLVTRPPGRYRASFLPLIALYLLTVIASLVLAGNRVAGAFIVFQVLQTGLLFFALAGELQRPSAVRALLKGLSIGLLIQASYVARQKVGGMIQAPGTFEHQNVLGLAVELSILPLIAAVMEGERSKLVYAGILAGAICVVGGGSRGTMGFLAIGAVVVVAGSVIRRGTRRKWQVVGLGAVAAAAVATLAVATLSERFGSGPFETEETARTALAEAARSMAADHPFTGVGANNFVIANNVGGYVERTRTPLTPATRSQPAHNAYLVARAERGFPGEASLILLLGGLATAAVLTAFKYRRSAFAGISFGAAGSILAVSLHSNFEYALLTPNLFSLLLVIGALVSGLRVLAIRERQAAVERRAGPVIATAAHGPDRGAARAADRPPARGRT
ncbi:O-antigen ligase family protein [Tsuneonella sp. HG249]